MSYSQNGKVEASDFNNFINGTWGSVWGTGSGNSGWGQTLPANVSVHDTIYASNYWQKLVNNVNTAGSQTNTSLGSMNPNPAQRGVVTYLPNLPTNITSLYNNRLNAAIQGSSNSTNVTNSNKWNQYLTFTFNIAFGNANQARYYFNAGGQVGISFSNQPPVTPEDTIITNICSYLGTIWLSSPTSGTCTLAGTNYNGVTKIGGTSGYDTTYSNNGFYALTSSNTPLIVQSTTTSYYSTNTNLTIYGSVSSNVLTLTCTFDEIPTGNDVSPGTTASLTLRPPSSTYLTNTWGTPSITSNVTYGYVPKGNSGIITTSGNFKVPADVTTMKVLAIAGGGGGGGGSQRTAHNPRGPGGGGGSGGAAYATISVTPGQQLIITVGAGGSGGNPCDGGYSPGTNGGNGSYSLIYYNGIQVYVIGGNGGKQAYNYSIGSQVPGGTQGTVTTGTNVNLGSDGGYGQYGVTQGGGSGGYGININTTIGANPVYTQGTQGLGGIGNDTGGAGGSSRLATQGATYGGGGGGGGSNNEFFGEPGGDYACRGSDGAVFLWWGY
jgi:hypothetical protein